MHATAPPSGIFGSSPSISARAPVQFNGAVQVGAGITLALGILPRLSALLLAGSLVPTTLAGHRFWEEEEDAARAQQTIQFLKNLGMLGGLLLVIEHG